MSAYARSALGIALLLFSACAAAQAYPAKTVRVVVPYPPGGGADVVGRILLPKLADVLGRPFVIDNRAGASGHVGAEIAAHSPPDGYTLLLTPGAVASSQPLYAKLNYDLEKDLDPISLLATTPFLLVVHPSLPVKNVRELIALARSQPGEMLFASTGIGGAPHLAMELLKLEAKVDIRHVPYKGTPGAITDLLAGQVSMMFANALSVLPFVNSGRLRALGVSGSKRSAASPKIPTIAESGLPGFESSTWFGILAPSGTPKEIVGRLNAELLKLVQSPSVRELLLAQGADPVGSTPQEFRARISADIAKWTKVVKAAGIKPQ